MEILPIWVILEILCLIGSNKMHIWTYFMTKVPIQGAHWGTWSGKSLFGVHEGLKGLHQVKILSFWAKKCSFEAVLDLQLHFFHKICPLDPKLMTFSIKWLNWHPEWGPWSSQQPKVCFLFKTIRQSRPKMTQISQIST